MLRFTSGYKTTDQSPHHHLLEAQQLGLVHDGEGEAAGEQRDAEEDHHGPEVADLSRLLPTVQTRGPAPTCRDWDLTMNLYLSTAMAMLVREDMYTVTQGKVFTNLDSTSFIVLGILCIISLSLIAKIRDFSNIRWKGL